MNNHEWDDNESPLAYLITFRTYGTWLHGDDRYTMDRHGKNVCGTPKVLPSKNLNTIMQENRAGEQFLLNGKQRTTVENAIRNVCKIRGYELMAINVRTNHVHVVVTAYVKPEKVINAFKANATRELRATGLVDGSQQVWSRGGSRRYLWKQSHLSGAIDYVLFGQGDDLPEF
ncbi:MAG: transposase [Pyrinomonadaceae bacterium]